ncbi:MAG: hypothetical protein JSU69_08525 [Candidatus Zixiibacteriota bacterium]|nr:MAG: hypothetical protein JSU69_08525 [candidate division Zixibacteria bacterium]
MAAEELEQPKGPPKQNRGPSQSGQTYLPTSKNPVQWVTVEEPYPAVAPKHHVLQADCKVQCIQKDKVFELHTVGLGPCVALGIGGQTEAGSIIALAHVDSGTSWSWLDQKLAQVPKESITGIWVAGGFDGDLTLKRVMAWVPLAGFKITPEKYHAKQVVNAKIVQESGQIKFGAWKNGTCNCGELKENKGQSLKMPNGHDPKAETCKYHCPFKLCMYGAFEKEKSVEEEKKYEKDLKDKFRGTALGEWEFLMKRPLTTRKHKNQWIKDVERHVQEWGYPYVLQADKIRELAEKKAEERQPGGVPEPDYNSAKYIQWREVWVKKGQSADVEARKALLAVEANHHLCAEAQELSLMEAKLGKTTQER